MDEKLKNVISQMRYACDYDLAFSGAQLVIDNEVYALNAGLKDAGLVVVPGGLVDALKELVRIVNISNSSAHSYLVAMNKAEDALKAVSTGAGGETGSG